MIGSKKSRREEGRDVRSKRRKVEDVKGQVWGEQMSEEERERKEFLQRKEESKRGGTVQTELRLKVLTGKEWFCLDIVKGVVGLAMAQSNQMEGVGDWVEWNETEEAEEPARVKRRTAKEEKELAKVLNEVDKREHKEALNIKKKEEKKQTKQVPKNQPLMTAFISKEVRSKEQKQGGYLPARGGDKSRDEVPDNLGGILRSEEELEKEARLRRKETMELPWLQRRKEIVREKLEKEARLRRKEAKEFPWVQRRKEGTHTAVMVTGKGWENFNMKGERPSRKVNSIIEHFKQGTASNIHVQRIFSPAKKRGFNFELLRSSLENQTKPGNEFVVPGSPAKRRRLYS